ncbi:MAG: hypothetical protein KDK06_07080 [Gammaproteobacteria bacterium]|nr:hypothetical protein [Gammaproteobacteria bacterium]
MNEALEHVVFGGLAVIAWVAWALCSETRHNHGVWVALLLPLLPLLVPLLWLVYGLIVAVTYVAFAARGRRDEHAEFMREFRARSGVFTLF